MPRKRTREVLSHLGAAERAEVLTELLEHHPYLSEEANAIAKDLIDEVSVEAVAEEVTDLVTGTDLDDLNGRAGRHSWGYVEPGEAAWELLEEALSEVRDDMTRRFEAGSVRAAENICHGIVLGLYAARGMESDGILGWAPDFPAETAADVASTFVEMYPPSRRKSAAKCFISVMKGKTGDWDKMLHRVVEEAVSAKRRK